MRDPHLYGATRLSGLLWLLPEPAQPDAAEQPAVKPGAGKHQHESDDEADDTDGCADLEAGFGTGARGADKTAQIAPGLLAKPADDDAGDDAGDDADGRGIARRITHQHQDRDGDQHDLRLGQAGQFRQDEAARAHDRDGIGDGRYGVGDGAARDRAEQAAGDDRDLARATDLIADRGQREFDEKSLRATLFEESAKDHAEDDLGREHVGHDAEHAITLVEDAGAQTGKGIATSVRDEFGCILAEYALQQHDRARLDSPVSGCS